MEEKKCAGDLYPYNVQPQADNRNYTNQKLES